MTSRAFQIAELAVIIRMSPHGVAFNRGHGVSAYWCAGLAEKLNKLADRIEANEVEACNGWQGTPRQQKQLAKLDSTRACNMRAVIWNEGQAKYEALQAEHRAELAAILFEYQMPEGFAEYVGLYGGIKLAHQDYYSCSTSFS